MTKTFCFTDSAAAKAMPFRELMWRTAHHGEMCPCAMCAEIRRR